MWIDLMSYFRINRKIYYNSKYLIEFKNSINKLIIQFSVPRSYPFMYNQTILWAKWQAVIAKSSSVETQWILCQWVYCQLCLLYRFTKNGICLVSINPPEQIDCFSVNLTVRVRLSANIFRQSIRNTALNAAGGCFYIHGMQLNDKSRKMTYHISFIR